MSANGAMADTPSSSVSTSVTPMQQIVSSCSGALLTSLLVTPLDVVKVRLQRQTHWKGSSDRTVGNSSSSTGRQLHHCSHHRGSFKALPRRFWAVTHGSHHKHCLYHRVSCSVTPLDVVKIRLQSQKRMISKGSCFIYSNGLMDHLCTCIDVNTKNTINGAVGRNQSLTCAWYARPGHFNGTLDAFVKIARAEGITSLWSGLSPTLVMAVPATVCYFTLYDNLNMELRAYTGSGLVLAPLLAGTGARLVTATIVSPLEMVRTKLQSERLNYQGIIKAVRTSVAGSGWRALWQGWGPTILRDVPFSAIYWVSYERLKSRFLSTFELSETNFQTSFASGAASGMLAAVITHPFDVVKTHRQIAIGEQSVTGGVKKPQLTTTPQIIRHLYRSHGLSSLFAGVIPRVVKIAPACAIMIGTYEYCKLYFKKQNAVLA